MSTEKTAFELGVKHGEYLGEILIGVFLMSGGGSAVFAGVKAIKTINRIAKVHKRINFSPQQILEDSIDANFEAF